MDKAWRLPLSMALLAVLTGCVARPVGDFGRVTPDYIHDTILPMAGEIRAARNRELVSGLNRTDQENEMQNRVWRFLVAPHGQDWQFDAAAELQRTRLVTSQDTRFTIERYYNWLKSTRFRSSQTRYAAVGSHIAADLDTLPTTFASICAVREIDRQRAIAYDGLISGLPPRFAGDVAARKNENDAYIAWFVRALNYRFNSYDFALDNLLVETPHVQSLAVDDALRRMADFVGRANSGDFCADSKNRASGDSAIIPSRYLYAGDNEVVLPK